MGRHEPGLPQMPRHQLALWPRMSHSRLLLCEMSWAVMGPFIPVVPNTNLRGPRAAPAPRLGPQQVGQYAGQGRRWWPECREQVGKRRDLLGVDASYAGPQGTGADPAKGCESTHGFEKRGFSKVRGAYGVYRCGWAGKMAAALLKEANNYSCIHSLLHSFSLHVVLTLCQAQRHSSAGHLIRGLRCFLEGHRAHRV